MNLFEEINFEHVFISLYIVFNQCSITELAKNFEQ